MATESRKNSRLYFRSKEAVAGTEDGYDFFEATSCIMTKPPMTLLQESNLGKLGSGEFGSLANTQAAFGSFSIKCSRLSEIAYLMSFCLGKADTIHNVDAPNSVYSHRLSHLAIGSRTLPTFSMVYDTTLDTYSMTHCVVSDFSITAASGGTGVIDATFNGFCNLYYWTGSTLTRNILSDSFITGTASKSLMEDENLVNYKGFNFYIGSAFEATPLVQTNVDYTASDLTGNQTITSLVNSMTITGNNGFTADDALRAGGSGIMNNQERKDYAFTLEMNVRKDGASPTSRYEDWLIADTQYSVCALWRGKTIHSANTYSMKWCYPKVQIANIAEDDESPINQTITYSVFGDTNGDAFEAFVQSKFSNEYNTNHV